MTIKPRVVRALRDARSRLRDVAAAEHSLAASDGASAAHRVESERGRLESALDDAHLALTAARTIHDLDRVAQLVTSHHDTIALAEKHHADTVMIIEAAAVRLRERARALRAAEHLVDLSDRHRATRDAKTEQRGNDDMSARRR